MKVEYEPAARVDVSDAVRWYGDVAGPAIADAFEFELDAVIQLLLAFPRLGSRGPRATRKLRLDRFPYNVHYRLEGDVIRVLAVAGQKRMPGYWRGR